MSRRQIQLRQYVTFWNVERGFGFVRRSNGKADVFVHVDQVAEDVQRLSVGDRVTFELGTDRLTGRPEAKLVALLDN